MIALSILYERNSVGIIYEESRGGLRVSRLSTHPQQGSALFISLLPRARSVWLHAHSHTAEIPSDWPLGLWSLLALQPPRSCFICISVFLFVPCLSTPPYLFDFTLVASWDVFDLCSSFFFFFFPSFFFIWVNTAEYFSEHFLHCGKLGYVLSASKTLLQQILLEWNSA